MPVTFDVEAAKQSGYSDEEIAQHLSSTRSFDYQGALQSGYSPIEIISHLTSKSPTTGRFNLPQKEQDKLLWLKQKIAEVARPTLEAGGLTVGAILGTPANVATGGVPLGTVAGGGVGYAAGKQAANILEEQLGAKETPPLKEQLIETGKDIATGTALQATGEITGKLLSSGFQYLKRFVTPGKSAITLNEIAAKEADSLVDKYSPKVASKAFFDQAQASGAQVPMNKTLEQINKMSAQLSERSTPPSALNYITKLKETIASRNNSLTPSQIQGELDSLGELISKREGTGLGALKQIFKGINEDLKLAGESEGAAELLAARRIYLREQTVNDMAEVFGSVSKLLRGQGENIQFNANQAIQKLEKNDFFYSAFDVAERKEIFGILRKLNSIPILRPKAGLQFGSGARIYNVAGAIYAAQQFGPKGLALGLVMPASENIYYIAQAFRYPAGRQLIADIIQKDAGKITPKSMAIIAAFVASKEASQP